MDVRSTAIEAVKIIEPPRFGDSRGWFSETWNARALAEAGLAPGFVQDNQSYSAAKGTIRGLHYQAPPFAQGKLVRVLSGAILDVAVDVRRGSPSFGAWVAEELSAANGRQLWVPEGFLHGFVTLEPDTMVFYKVTAHYDRASDGAVRFDDPDIGIDWGLDAGAATVSDKDAAAQSFAEFDSPFTMERRA